MTTDEKLSIYFEMEKRGFSAKDIAEKLNMSEKALRNLLRRKNFTCVNGKYVPKDNNTCIPKVTSIQTQKPLIEEAIKPRPKTKTDSNIGNHDLRSIKEELLSIKDIILEMKGSITTDVTFNELAISSENHIYGNETEIKELKHFSIRADKDTLNSFHELCERYPNINKSYMFTLALKEFIENHN